MATIRKQAKFMPNTGQHRYIINKKTLQILQDYQKNLVEGRVNPGGRLLAEINHFLSAGHNEFEPNKPLTAQDLQRIRGLKPADFMQLIMNTRVPTIFAESQAQVGEGAMWNNTEYEILGNISSVIENVKVYDNGKYQTKGTGQGQYMNSPDDVTLMCIPGAILKPPHTIDRDKILTKEADGTVQIDEEKYKQFYKNRLQMLLQNANDQSKKNGKNAFITLPGIGNGAFGGEFSGQTIPYLSNTLKELLKENPQWKNIGCVWIDGFSSPVCEDEKIGNTKLRVRNTRPGDTGNNLNKNRQLINGKPFSSLGQLSRAQEFAESGMEQEEFARCQRFKILAWDHFSFEGNDWINGARQTDEANMASCNALGILSGASGRYRNSDPNKIEPPYAYYPPDGYPTWNHYYHHNNIKQSISDRLYVCDDNGQFLQLENYQREKELLGQQSKAFGSTFGVTNVVLKSSNYQPGNNEHNAQQPLASIQFEFQNANQMQVFSSIIPKNQFMGSGWGNNNQLYVQVHPDYIKSLNQASVQQKKVQEPVATVNTMQAHATPLQSNVLANPLNSPAPAPKNSVNPTPFVPHVTKIPGGLTQNKALELLQEFRPHLLDAQRNIFLQVDGGLRSDSELIPELIRCLESLASGTPYSPANLLSMSHLNMGNVTAVQGIMELLPMITTALDVKDRMAANYPKLQTLVATFKAEFVSFQNQLQTPEKTPLADNLVDAIPTTPFPLRKIKPPHALSGHQVLRIEPGADGSFVIVGKSSLDDKNLRKITIDKNGKATGYNDSEKLGYVGDEMFDQKVEIFNHFNVPIPKSFLSPTPPTSPITHIPGGLTQNRASKLLQEFEPHLNDAQKNIFKQVDGGLRSDDEVIPELIQCLKSLASGKPYSPTNLMSMSHLNMGNVTAEQGILRLLPMITEALEVKEKMIADYPKLKTPVATFKAQFASLQKQLQTPNIAENLGNSQIKPSIPLMIDGDNPVTHIIKMPDGSYEIKAKNNIGEARSIIIDKDNNVIGHKGLGNGLTPLENLLSQNRVAIFDHFKIELPDSLGLPANTLQTPIPLDNLQVEKITAFMHHFKVSNTKQNLTDNISIVGIGSPYLSFGNYTIMITGNPAAPLHVSAQGLTLTPKEQIQVMHDLLKDPEFVRLQMGVPAKTQLDKVAELIRTLSTDGFKKRVGNNFEFIGKIEGAAAHMLYQGNKVVLTGDPNKPVAIFTKSGAPYDLERYEQLLSNMLRSPQINQKQVNTPASLIPAQVEQVANLINRFKSRAINLSSDIQFNGATLLYNNYQLQLTNDPNRPFLFADKDSYLIDPQHHGKILDEILQDSIIKAQLVPPPFYIEDNPVTSIIKMPNGSYKIEAQNNTGAARSIIINKENNVIGYKNQVNDLTPLENSLSDQRVAIFDHFKIELPESLRLTGNQIQNAQAEKRNPAIPKPTPTQPLQITDRERILINLITQQAAKMPFPSNITYGKIQLYNKDGVPTLQFENNIQITLTNNPATPFNFQQNKHIINNPLIQKQILQNILAEPNIAFLQQNSHSRHPNVVINNSPVFNVSPAAIVHPQQPAPFVPQHPSIQKHVPHQNGAPGKVWPAKSSQIQPMPISPDPQKKTGNENQVKLTPQQGILLDKINKHIDELGGRDRSDRENAKLKALLLLRTDVKNNKYIDYTTFLKVHANITDKEKDEIKAGVFSKTTKGLFEEADVAPRPK